MNSKEVKMESLDFLSALTETGLNPVDYQYFHQLFDNRTVIFNQEIQENIVECVYLPLRDFERDGSILMLIDDDPRNLKEVHKLSEDIVLLKDTVLED